MHVAQHCTRRVTMVKNPVTSDDKRGKSKYYYTVGTSRKSIIGRLKGVMV